VAAAEAMPCVVRVRCARRRSPGMEAVSGGRAWGGCHVLKSWLPAGNGGACHREYVTPRGRPGD
jgi:hypothetical protein